MVRIDKEEALLIWKGLWGFFFVSRDWKDKYITNSSFVGAIRYIYRLIVPLIDNRTGLIAF